MPARIPMPESRAEELAEFRKARWTGLEFQRYLCVWLRTEKGLPASEIAGIVGWHADTVRLIQRGFIARGAVVFRDEREGGRRSGLLSLEEEAKFLKGFMEAASDASLLVANEVKAALEKKLGREVHKVSVYRMLKRHNWRKIMPRPRHPEQDKEAVEAFKKGATQKQPGKPGWKPRRERCH